jgi:hypothetical protein
MPYLRRDWLKGGIDFFSCSTSRIGDTIISLGLLFLLCDCILKEPRSLPDPRSTCRRACPPTESPEGRGWAKAGVGVVFASSGLDETSWEALPCRLR